MPTTSEVTDAQLLDLLRKRGSLCVSDVIEASGVTATAVRQRLNRLMAQGLVERVVDRVGRGRPSHRYSLTSKARRQAGSNFGDLAIVLWTEIRSIKDPEVRRGLLQRLARTMASMYGGAIHGVSLGARMESLKALFGERRVAIEVDDSRELPALTVLDCPYAELAEADRGVCAMERMLFAELLQADVRLTECRLDGHECCRFEKASA